jgi:hypothetical protein
LHIGKRRKKSVSDEVALKSEYSSQIFVILDKTEAGASACHWGPIYVLQKEPNYPT